MAALPEFQASHLAFPPHPLSLGILRCLGLAQLFVGTEVSQKPGVPRSGQKDPLQAPSQKPLRWCCTAGLVAGDELGSC